MMVIEMQPTRLGWSATQETHPTLRLEEFGVAMSLAVEKDPMLTGSALALSLPEWHWDSG